jgi:hypothetical protein
MLEAQSPSSSSAPGMDQVDSVPAASLGRKRKSESQDNERLSKRLSLLNIGKYNQLQI